MEVNIVTSEIKNEIKIVNVAFGIKYDVEKLEVGIV